MRFATLVGAALLGLAAAQSCPYPGIESSLAACKTGAAFCSTLLGRGPTVTVVNVEGAYTTTVPAKTFTYVVVTSSTVKKTTTLPTSTKYITEISCVTAASGAALKAPAPAVTAVAAAGASCGVGRFSSAWVSNACECEYDTTIYLASTTKTKKAGTTLYEKMTTRTTTTTRVFYSTTTSVTTTLLKDNCFPPANASCLNPSTCDEFYNTYQCGTDGEYECSCGIDSHGLATCFHYGYCSDFDACEFDYDCPHGQFCLYDSCCVNSICSPYDVCIGDTASSLISATAAAAATPAVQHAPGLHNGKNTGWAKRDEFGQM